MLGLGWKTSHASIYLVRWVHRTSLAIISYAMARTSLIFGAIDQTNDTILYSCFKQSLHTLVQGVGMDVGLGLGLVIMVFGWVLSFTSSISITTGI
jgi:hypothetical protein